MVTNYRALMPPRSKGSGCVCVCGNEVMTVVNSKVTCPIVHLGANSGCRALLHDVRCRTTLSAGPF